MLISIGNFRHQIHIYVIYLNIKFGRVSLSSGELTNDEWFIGDTKELALKL